MNHDAVRGVARLAAGLAALATSSAVQGQTRIIYVDDDAASGGDGTAWSKAYRDLQDAIAAVEPGTDDRPIDTEIHIAGGIYRPDRGTLDRTAQFKVVGSVRDGVLLSLLGGFEGLSGPTPDARDPSVYTTVLSGDLKGDDSSGGRTDNSDAILEASSVGSVLVDGLEISSAGRPDSHGGAVFVQGLPANSRDRGIIFRGVRFVDNRADFGAAIRISGSTSRTVTQLIGCEFVGNRAASSGGAIWAIGPVSVSRCRFIGNRAAEDGGALSVEYPGRAAVRSSIFAGNTALRGGAVSQFQSAASAMTIDLCLFAGNVADLGAAISSHNAQVRDSIVRYGYPTASGTSLSLVHALPYGAGFVSVERCNIEKPDAWVTGDVARFEVLDGAIDADPVYVNEAGADGVISTWLDNDLRLAAGSPCIDAGRRISPRDGEFDLAGSPRFIDGDGDGVARIDIGPYESAPPACPADIDHSGFVDTEDFDAFIRAFESGC